MNDFTYNGFWWLPNAPEKKVAGTIRFSEERGAELNLFGNLGESEWNLSKRYEIILGSVWDSPHGEDVTLHDSWVRRMKFGSIEDYHVSYIFIGYPFERAADLQFSRAGLSYSGLSSWASKFTGFRRSGGMEIAWEKPPEHKGDIPAGTLTLGIGAKGSMKIRDRSISESVSLVITPDAPVSFLDLNKRYVAPLENFFTLATDHPNALTEFDLRPANSKEKVRVFAQRIFTDASVAAELMPHDMLFTLPDVEQPIEAMGRWIDVADRFSGALAPYFSTFSKPETLVDVQLILTFQALEAFERLLPNSAAGTELGGSVRHQVQRLLQEHWIVLEPLFDDQVKAVQELMRYRSFAVHSVGGLEQQPDFGETLYWLTQRLKAVMKACLLDALGFSQQEQLTLFRKNRLFVHMANLPKPWMNAGPTS